MIPIKNITDENPFVKTFWFDFKIESKPGQFVMLWIPGVDQKPFSIAYDSGQLFGLTIFNVGVFTKKLFSLKPGDRVGVTGPYGKPYTIKPNTHYITVGGGYGAGPLGILTESVADKNCTVDFCVGARNKDLLLFEDRVAKLTYATPHIATNDGSRGHQGYVTDILEELLEKYEKSREKGKILVATCGPELMEKKVLMICNQYEVDCELSIERYMKCGFNVCGQCCVDDLGITMCSQGPVVNRETANKIKEFGVYHRDKSGTKHSY